MQCFVHGRKVANSLARGKTAAAPKKQDQQELSVARDDHPFELEADRAAGQALNARVSNGTPPSLGAAGQGAGSPIAPASDSVKDVLASPGRPLDAATRQVMEPRFRQDFLRVRIHADGEAAESARSIRAQAWTAGNHIAFGAGQFEPTHPAGQNLLAHELAHTVQARSEAVPQTVWRRRIPDAGDLSSTLPAGATDLAAHEKGLIQLIRQAWEELSTKKRADILFEADKAGIVKAVSTGHLFTVLETTPRDKLLQFVELVRKADPTVTLGDPALARSLPRNAADKTNIADLLTEADKVFDAVASGARDSDLTDIFGSANAATAKTKFANAKKAAHTLQTANKIFADRSGAAAEMHVGGASNTVEILLQAKVVDHPHNVESITTMVHESAHAGNADVDDLGYIDSPRFPQMPDAKKINNAADFEVIAFRVLDSKNPRAFPGQTFVEPGTGSTPPSTQRQDAMQEANRTYEHAWDAALSIHDDLVVREFQKPSEWNTFDVSKIEPSIPAGTHFSQILPFWSKVENLTIHQRPGINPSSGKADAKPVTSIDLALSEAVARKMANGQRATRMKDADAAALESKATGPQKKEIPKGVHEEAQVLVSLVRTEKVGEITGPLPRDLKVIDRLAKMGELPDPNPDLLAPKDPKSFP